jgi:hypothetical protein
MPLLRDRQRQRNATKTTTASPTAHLDFVADPGYMQPIRMGILRSTGRTLSLIQLGNTPGLSPTWRVNDEYGVPAIVSLGDVIETGLLCGPIPNPAEQLEEIFSNLKFRDQPST